MLNKLDYWDNSIKKDAFKLYVKNVSPDFAKLVWKDLIKRLEITVIII